MRRSSAALGIGFLTLLAGRPTGEQQGDVGMRSALENCCRVYRCRTLGKKIVDRSTFLDPGRIVMRVTREASRCLTRHQELGELRMTLVKLRMVGGDLSQQRHCL